MSVSDVAIGLGLDPRDYNSGMDAAEKRQNRFFAGFVRNAKSTSKELKNVGKEASQAAAQMSKLDRFTRAAEKIGNRADKFALGLGAVSLATKGAAAFATYKMKAIQSMKEIDAADAANLLKWQQRRDKMARWSAATGKMAGVAGGVSIAGRVGSLAGRAFGGNLGGVAAIAGGAGRAKSGVDQLTGSIDRLSAAAGRSSGAGSKLGGLLGTIGGAAGKIALGGIGAGIGAGVGIGALLFQGTQLNSDLEQATASFEVFTGSVEIARNMVAGLKKDADKTPFSTAEVIATGSALVANAGKSQKKLMELVKTAEMLTVLNPNKAAGGGLESAAIAMKNAMSGDFVSLQDRFNIAPAEIQALKDKGLSGVELIQALLQAKNITEASIARMGETFSGRMSTIMSFVDSIKAKFAEPFFQWASSKAALATQWIEKNGEWALNVARGIGMSLLEKMKGVWEFAKQIPGYFMIASNWAASIGESISKAWSGGEFGKFASEFGAKLWDLVKKLGSFLFDMLVLAGEKIGAKISESITGKTEEQSGLDRMWKIHGKKSPEELQKELASAQEKEKNAGNPLTRQMAKNEVWALKKVIAGDKVAVGRSFSGVVGNHAAGIAGSAANVGATASNFVGNTLGGNAAVQAAAAGNTGVLGPLAAAGAQQSLVAGADDRQNRREAAKARFASTQSNIFAQAAGLQQKYGTGGMASAQGMLDQQHKDNAARYQAEMAGIESQADAAYGDPAAAPAQPGKKAAKAAAAYNAKAQPININISGQQSITQGQWNLG